MARKFLTGADLNGQKVSNMADGSAPADAVTLAQLDAVARGLDWKASVRAATTANITLSGAQTIDSVAVVAGDRVLVKDQTDGTQNGIYVVAAGAWTRATDFANATTVTSAAAVAVESGTAAGDSAWLLATDGAITVGTTALSFTRLGGTGVTYTAGNGLSLTGSQFAVVAAAGGGLVSAAGGVSIDTAYTGFTKKYAADVPAGATSATITHNLGTTDVLVRVRENSTGATVECDEVTLTTTTAVLTFATAPTAAQYRVVIIG